jgi:hypothetical protein
MTITSVTVGEGKPEGGWGEGAWVCASTVAIGSTDIRKGSSSFTIENLDSVCFGGVLLACLIFARGARFVTRSQMIDFPQESGHKDASRGKEGK